MTIIEGLIVLGMVIFSACAKDYHEADITYQLSTDYPQLAEEQVSKIESLANEHFLHADSDMHIIVVPGDIIHDHVAETNCQYSHRIKYCTITFNNYWLFSVSYISEERRKEFFKLVLTHEIGHAFGLVHVSDMHNIMYPEGIVEYQDNIQSYWQYISDIKRIKNQ